MVHNVERPIDEKNKAQIENKLQTMGDYVQMSYLQRALKSGLDFDTRKFVLLRLGGIYEARRMHLEAAKMIKAAAEINTTYREKIRDYMKATELFIKGQDYPEADRLFAQSLALGNSQEKLQMKQAYKNFYLTQAKLFENSDKRTNAKETYEKVLALELDIGERTQVQKSLLDLYDKLGKIKEYYALKQQM